MLQNKCVMEGWKQWFIWGTGNICIFVKFHFNLAKSALIQY